jgi:hypothetical protein
LFARFIIIEQIDMSKVNEWSSKADSIQAEGGRNSEDHQQLVCTERSSYDRHLIQSES